MINFLICIRDTSLTKVIVNQVGIVNSFKRRYTQHICIDRKLASTINKANIEIPTNCIACVTTLNVARIGRSSVTNKANLNLKVSDIPIY